MNVYELEKKATPGPWVVQGGQDKRTSVDVTLTARTPVYRNPRYVGRIYGQGALTNDCSERDSNAALIAHCRNHFIEALEALKKAKDVIRLTGVCDCRHAYYPEDDVECTSCAIVRELRDLINKLETVEGI